MSEGTANDWYSVYMDIFKHIMLRLIELAKTEKEVIALRNKSQRVFKNQHKILWGKDYSYEALVNKLVEDVDNFLGEMQ